MCMESKSPINIIHFHSIEKCIMGQRSSSRRFNEKSSNIEALHHVEYVVSFLNEQMQEV